MKKARQITQGRKFEQVLNGARKVFMRDGYSGASVDDIARQAAVSKATLYSYFPDKRQLYTEVFRGELARDRYDIEKLFDRDLPLKELLDALAEVIMGHFNSHLGSQTYRLAVAEAERFPSLSRDYYREGSLAAQKLIAEQLIRRQSQGELRDDIDDMHLVADTFIHLCAVRIQDHRNLLGGTEIDDAMLAAISKNAVTTFMRAYGMDTGGRVN